MSISDIRWKPQLRGVAFFLLLCLVCAMRQSMGGWVMQVCAEGRVPLHSPAGASHMAAAFLALPCLIV